MTFSQFFIYSSLHLLLVLSSSSSFSSLVIQKYLQGSTTLEGRRPGPETEEEIAVADSSSSSSSNSISTGNALMFEVLAVLLFFT